MGTHQSRVSSTTDRTYIGEEINFDHFQILRAIGKGSFGKVCIVQKRDTGQMFAMKYMNKLQCIERDALKNVIREVNILTKIEHTFIVNLWFTFQDEEDLFMVFDLYMGGDLRYHINQSIKFNEPTIVLYICELGLALDYLQTKHIIHRDIKPDNILLDNDGHVHLTDFNIATELDRQQLATSMSGTKPYIAPEIYECAIEIELDYAGADCAVGTTVGTCIGYSYPVDWWSLGVVAYEMLNNGCRPFDIHSNTSIADIRALFVQGVQYPNTWSNDIIDLISKLLCISPGERITNIHELKQHNCIINTYNIKNMDVILNRQYNTDIFIPEKGHLNCDPTFELEEMIIEQRPLHKKKKRLAKQRSLTKQQQQQQYNTYLKQQYDCTNCDIQLTNDIHASDGTNCNNMLIPEYRVYNRYHELKRREMEQKELEWEHELLEAMNASSPSSSSTITTNANINTSSLSFNNDDNNVVTSSSSLSIINNTTTAADDNNMMIIKQCYSCSSILQLHNSKKKHLNKQNNSTTSLTTTCKHCSTTSATHVTGVNSTTTTTTTNATHVISSTINRNNIIDNSSSQLTEQSESSKMNDKFEFIDRTPSPNPSISIINNST